MEARAINAPRTLPPVPSLGGLIDALGSPSFPSAVFKEVQALCGCAHFVALASNDRGPINVLVAANIGPTQVARQTADRYVAEHWRHDPVNELLASLGDADMSVRTTPRDIGPRQYRRDCYSRPNLDERVSLLRRRNNVISRLHFYRARGTGSFSPRQIDAIAGAADVLFSLVSKHSALARSNRPHAYIQDFRRRILSVLPDMPQREADVCVGIARGQTSEAIAIDLGIGLNTVLTYRKRLYSRLGVSSACELLACIFGAQHLAD